MHTKVPLPALIMAVFLAVSVGISAVSAQSTKDRSADSAVIYFFHTNSPCPKCHDVEKWVKEAVDIYFKDEERLGRVVLKTINTETKGNEHFMHDYKLYVTSVVLVLVKGGKEIKSTNLAKVWEYSGSGEKFKAYIKDEVSKYLMDL